KVVVVDSQGNLLSGEGGSEALSHAGSFLDYKSQFETYLSQKAQDMLTTVLGPGKATVKVDATIQTSSITMTEELYDPVNKVLSKEDIKSSTSTAGTPAKDSQASTGGNTKEENVSTEYMVSKKTEQRTDL